jgi:hypothetical protein
MGLAGPGLSAAGKSTIWERNMQSATIPSDYFDLANGPRVAALTTIMPDGQPQTTVAPNKVTLLVVDPEDTARYIEIRGDGELVQTDELRTIVRLCANKITLDAIHK